MKNLLFDLRNYKDRLSGLLIRLMTLLIIWVLLTITLFLVMNSYLNDLGNARVTALESEVSTLFDSLDRLMLELTQGYNLESYSDVFNPSLSDLDELQDALPVECIEQVMVYDSRRQIIKTEHGAYAYMFLDEILGEIGETAEHFEALLEELEEPLWILSDGDGESSRLYCLAPVYTGVSYESEWLLLVLDPEVLDLYLDTFDDQSYYYLLFGDLYYSNIGNGRLSGSEWTVSLIQKMTPLSVRIYTIAGTLFTYTVAIPWMSYYLSEAVVFACFLFYAVLLVLLELRSFAAYRRQNEEKITQTLRDLSENLEETPGETDAGIIDSIYEELRRYQNQSEFISLNDRSHNIRHILFGHFQGCPSKERLDAAGIDSDCGSYYVATFFINDYSDMFFDDRDPGDNVQAAHMMLQSTLSGLMTAGGHVTSCSIGGSCTAIFCMPEPGQAPDRPEAEEVVISVLRQATHLIESNYGLTICTVLSHSVTSPEALCHAYRETEKTFRMAKAIGSESDLIVCSRQTYCDVLTTEGDFLKQIKIITNTLLMEDYELIPDMVDALIREDIQPLSDNVDLAQSRLYALSNLLTETVRECNLPEGQTNEYARAILSSSSAAILSENTRRIFGEITQREHADAPKDTLSQACEYIQEHVSDPNLSVVMICDRLGVSRQYLSRIFKQKLNRTVAVYINEYRINYSKELLATTGMNVAEIAAAVGYALPDTYTRNFKKMEHLTPTEYRKMM